MAFNERHNEIIKILNNLKTVTVQVLTERLQVSEVTIRKDLSFLESQGKLLRTHGGAVLSEDRERIYSLREKSLENIDTKELIAKKARQFIRENDTIYIDSGSTCLLLAKEIKDMNLTVVTNSLDVMVDLSKYQQISLISVGGNLRYSAGSFIGPIAEMSMKNFQIETCFLGASGISKEGVFSSQNLIESQLKIAVIKASGRKIILADRSKYGVQTFSIFAKPGDIDILITDKDFPDLDNLRSQGIEIILS